MHFYVGCCHDGRLCSFLNTLSFQETQKVQRKKDPSPIHCIECELEIVHECPEDYQDHQASATSFVSSFCTLKDQSKLLGKGQNQIRKIKAFVSSFCTLEDLTQTFGDRSKPDQKNQGNQPLANSLALFLQYTHSHITTLVIM